MRAARRAAERCEIPPALVLIGRHAGPVPEHGGVAISMEHHDLPPHPRRITTLVGFGHRDDWRPAIDPAAWSDWLDRPRRCALLLGRNPARRPWRDDELSELLDRALEWSERRNARLLIVTTSDSIEAGRWFSENVVDRSSDCEDSGSDNRGADGSNHRADVYAWSPDDNRNPYSLALEHAGSLLVAGASPGVLQDALASPRPVYLVPDTQRPGLRARIAARIADRAFRPSYNKRGSIRPQQGPTYLCARLVERGWVVPPTGLQAWQRRLVERGLAAWIGAEAVPSGRYEPELDSVCDAAITLLQPGSRDRGSTKHARPHGS